MFRKLSQAVSREYKTRSQNKKLRRELGSLEEENKHLTSRLEEEVDTCAQTTAQLSALTEQHEDLERTQEESNSKLSSLARHLRQALTFKSRFQAAQQRADRLIRENRALEGRLQDADEKSEAHAAAVQHISLLTHENDNLQAQNATLLQQSNSLHLHLTSANTSLHDLHAQLSLSTAQVDKLTKSELSLTEKLHNKAKKLMDKLKLLKKL